MDVWQRGTSFAGIASSTYTADRWISVLQGTSISCTATQDTSVPSVNFKYSLKYQQLTTSATSVAQYTARQVIEQTNVLPLLGKSATLSFWYRSNKTGSHGVRILATFNTGGTDQATTFTVNAANTWEYKTVAVTALSTVTAASASPTGIGALVDIGFRVDAAGFTTIAANDFFQFTGVQLELGSTATTFSRAGGTIQGELAACQRYFQIYGGTQSYELIGSSSVAASSTSAYAGVDLLVEMRTTPSIVTSFYSNVNEFTLDGGNNNYRLTALSLNSGANAKKVRLNCTVASGLTTSSCYPFLTFSTSTGKLALSSEL
jgi:hypothetical protein